MLMGCMFQLNAVHVSVRGAAEVSGSVNAGHESKCAWSHWVRRAWQRAHSFDDAGRRSCAENLPLTIALVFENCPRSGQG
jgi:hypothetical protein